jgi:hypothetical protein
MLSFHLVQGTTSPPSNLKHDASALEISETLKGLMAKEETLSKRG